MTRQTLPPLGVSFRQLVGPPSSRNGQSVTKPSLSSSKQKGDTVHKTHVAEEGLGLIIWVTYLVERLVVIIVSIPFPSTPCSQGKDLANDLQGLAFRLRDVLEHKNPGYESDYGEEAEHSL